MLIFLYDGNNKDRIGKYVVHNYNVPNHYPWGYVVEWTEDPLKATRFPPGEKTLGSCKPVRLASLILQDPELARRLGGGDVAISAKQ